MSFKQFIHVDGKQKQSRFRKTSVFNRKVTSTEQSSLGTYINSKGTDNGRAAEPYVAELQWLEHLWNHENMFETGVVRTNEC